MATVRLEVPAGAKYATVVRAVASRVAALGGLSVDRVEDLRLAVSEAFTTFLGDATNIVSVEVDDAAGDVRIRLSAPVAGTADDPETQLSRQLAQALVDDSKWEFTDEVIVTLVMHRESAVDSQ